MKRLPGKPVLIGGAILLFGVGTLTVQAAPSCVRFVKQYSEKLTHHRVSKATAARWAEWNKDHPNYHPKKRKPRLSPTETMNRVNFDCQVDTTEMQPSLIATDFPQDTLIPPGIMYVSFTPKPKPFVLSGVPVTPPPVLAEAETPEPGTWLLLGTGAAAMALAMRRRKAAEASLTLA